ncbi:hypothetical protein MTIN_18810 [Moorella thermoacetica]|nr:hypothetical protein MTIN_18810 [Moorella thermoacetica]
MRLSEKTIELNFCAQSSAFLNQRLIWFGLTQKQEAKAGFDACTRVNGRLMIFQFKASNMNIRGGRRFNAPHNQMQNLINRVRHFQRSVFYVFPLIGTTYELEYNNGDILSNTWLLDVATIPPLPLPTTRRGTPRSKGIHYIDVIPPKAIIHSEPVEVNLINAAEFLSQGAPGVDGIQNLFVREDHDFEEYHLIFRKNTCGAILLPRFGW